MKLSGAQTKRSTVEALQPRLIGAIAGPTSRCAGYCAKFWCPEPESNRYGPIRVRRILSPLCLPISPPGRVSDAVSQNLLLAIILETSMIDLSLQIR